MRAAICTSDEPKARFTTRRLKKRPARHNGRHGGGRPTGYGSRIAKEICVRIASGDTLRAACIALRIPEDTVYGWLSSHDEFRQTYAHARDIRADIAVGEQMLKIADNTSDDWHYNEKTGKLSVKQTGDSARRAASQGPSLSHGKAGSRRGASGRSRRTRSMST